MYTNENIDFVQPSSIGSTYARKVIPVGAILKFDSLRSVVLVSL